MINGRLLHHSNIFAVVMTNQIYLAISFRGSIIYPKIWLKGLILCAHLKRFVSKDDDICPNERSIGDRSHRPNWSCKVPDIDAQTQNKELMNIYIIS